MSIKKLNKQFLKYQIKVKFCRILFEMKQIPFCISLYFYIIDELLWWFICSWKFTYQWLCYFVKWLLSNDILHWSSIVYEIWLFVEEFHSFQISMKISSILVVDSELPKYNYVSKRFDSGIQTDYRTNFNENVRKQANIIMENNIKVNWIFINQNIVEKVYNLFYVCWKYFRLSISETNPCKIGYSLSPQDKCVNLLNDFYNCGSFGYVCEKTFKTCSGGKCSVVSPVQLSSSDILTDWIGSRDIDDSNITVSLPFEVKLYDQSSSEVTVTTNGVSELSFFCVTKNLFRLSVSDEIVRMNMKIRLFLVNYMLIQPYFVIGMICEYFTKHHKVYTIALSVLHQIEQSYLNIIWVVMNRIHHFIIFKLNSTKINLESSNVFIWKCPIVVNQLQ